MSWLGRATILAALVAAFGCDDTRRTNVDAGPVITVDAGPVITVDGGPMADAGPTTADAGPTGSVYATCFGPEDCLAALDQCLEVDIPGSGTSGGYCSRGCTADAECPARGSFEGVCYSLDASSAICFQQCDFDSDCHPGSVCIEVDLGGEVDFICVPDN